MEQAAYEYLYRVAARAGDDETEEVAKRILEQEKAMKGRIFDHFSDTVEASLREKNADDLREELTNYLTDAHAIEAQGVQMLEASPKIVGDVPELEKLFADHLEETKAHQQILEARLDELGAKPNKLQDAALRLGAINLGGFFKAQPDTPAKLAGFNYAFEHLEIAAYEELKRVAERAGDQETVRVAERIGGEERAAANAIAANWEVALQASLESVGAVA
jgi:ferritin-like metal-binding protein YciE